MIDGPQLVNGASLIFLANILTMLIFLIWMFGEAFDGNLKGVWLLFIGLVLSPVFFVAVEIRFEHFFDLQVRRSLEFLFPCLLTLLSCIYMKTIHGNVFTSALTALPALFGLFLVIEAMNKWNLL